MSTKVFQRKAQKLSSANKIHTIQCNIQMVPLNYTHLQLLPALRQKANARDWLLQKIALTKHDICADV